MMSRILLDKHPIISNQISRPALGVVLDELEKVIANRVPGAVVELGCYIGTTSLFIRRLLNEAGEADRPFHAYDSFEGLPDKAPQDQSAAGINFKAGELQASKKQFLHEFHKANLKPPITHKAWFNDLRPQDLPEQIAFAFLDGDFYDSILTSLQLVWPRLSPGATVCIDDYQRETLPGVERAVNQFFQGRLKPPKVAHNIAVINNDYKKW